MASTFDTAIASPTTISWAATLHPFTREFPKGTDWIQFARTSDPTGPAGKLASQWVFEDSSNAALQQAIPESFVRNAHRRRAIRRRTRVPSRLSKI